MIHKTRLRHSLRGGVAMALVGAMVLSQPQVVEATRSVSDIQQEQNNLDQEIGSLGADLEAVVASIASLQVEIEQKQQEIAEAEVALQEAQAAVDKQYADMKLRIQFMYENGDKGVLEILLESGSISDFLNRLEYVNAVHSYDRDLLDSYEAIKQEVESMKLGLEEEKKNLVSAESQLESQKAELDSLLASKKMKKADLDKELKQAQEEARRQQQAQQQNNNGGGGSTGTSENLNPPNISNISGASVVAYANQFVGGPYVWGGNSLTNGCDCSGFVHLVYRDFGISVPRYSGAFASIGQEVSYNNMQPGDIIVYQPKAGIGHVAIYAGNGCIVEAQSSAAGITNNRAANCRPIWTIRRVL
ncbi:MAG: NlpC/P60 family protein [Lachnospiraceae bacterium]|nr:NlpC/P60 family protein [Lachnospiraceae bacterium]